MLLPKPIRQTDEEFLELVRNEPCAGCGRPPRSDPNHLRTVGARGSDLTAAPMCRTCHRAWHDQRSKWEREHPHVNLWRANSELLQRYLTDPTVIFRKAAELLEEDNDLARGHAALVRRILDALVVRAARTDALNGNEAQLSGGGAPDHGGELPSVR
jgi:hypothetical protein